MVGQTEMDPGNPGTDSTRINLATPQSPPVCGSVKCFSRHPVQEPDFHQQQEGQQWPDPLWRRMEPLHTGRPPEGWCWVRSTVFVKIFDHVDNSFWWIIHSCWIGILLTGSH